MTSVSVYAGLGNAAPAVDAFAMLCAFNSVRRGADQPVELTPFHCEYEPPISIAAYVERFVRYLRCTEEGVLMAIVLARRYGQRTGTLPSLLTAHRLLLAATVIAVKCHHDRFASNKHYAEIGGVSLDELNGLEIVMFNGLGFHTRIAAHEFRRLEDGSHRVVALLEAASGRRRCETSGMFCTPALTGDIAEALEATFTFDSYLKPTTGRHGGAESLQSSAPRGLLPNAAVEAETVSAASDFEVASAGKSDDDDDDDVSPPLGLAFSPLHEIQCASTAAGVCNVMAEFGEALAISAYSSTAVQELASPDLSQAGTEP